MVLLCSLVGRPPTPSTLNTAGNNATMTGDTFFKIGFYFYEHAGDKWTFGLQVERRELCKQTQV